MATIAIPNQAQPAQPMTMPVVPPDLSRPLINEPAQANPPAPTDALGPLQHLVGTWTNQNLAGTNRGGPDSPYSYNLMILPQVDPSSPEGYILKSMPYYEEITFAAIHGTAPNRGGLGTQVSNTLFYEQRIYIAAGPAKDQLVHAENGSWLFLSDRQQYVGPYGDTPIPNSSPPTQQYNLIKQMSVPHGNSILASGTFTAPIAGPPVIAPPLQVLPVGIGTAPYTTKGDGNLDPAFTLNPNLPLTTAVGINVPTNYIELNVDTFNGGIPPTNIGFEQQHAKVTRYSATYWLEAFGGDYTQLQYTQTILMAIPIAVPPGSGLLTLVSFPHITTNTLTKVTGAAPGADLAMIRAEQIGA
ncbi:MAG: hypothetical protein JWO81_1534 [Alphaproteobacteria bacterium]|nr:hypothetical protein [Alphaproteobacteria bacterium]